MPVVKNASYTKICPFSKTLIKPTNTVCLFNQKQFDKFNSWIITILNNLIPLELIHIIINMTKYKNHIGKFGHFKFVQWNINYKIKKYINNKNISDQNNSDEDNSDEDNSDE